MVGIIVPEGSRVVQVMTVLRQAVGVAAPEERLPSIRRLAQRQGVSPSTVVEAYERLVAEGLVAARPGSGFYAAGRRRPLALAQGGPRLDRAIDPLWIMRQSLEMPAGALRPGCGWLPDSWLPQALLRQVLRAQARDPNANLTAYGAPAGPALLRQLLAGRLSGHGIDAAPDDILITDSGSAAIDLVCRFLLRPGDCVLIDDPGYFNFQAMLRAQRVTVVGVPATPVGPDLAAFAALAGEHRPKLYLTTSALHNPTGATLSSATAHRLLRLAEAHDLIVVEDDIFADFEAMPSPRLAAMDGFERVIHLGSFSKTLSAASRCGYIAAKRDWIDGLTDLKLATSFGHHDLSAQLVTRLLAEGSYRRHVEALRTRLARARERVIARLRALGLEPWLVPRSGMLVWVELPEGGDSAALALSALARNVVLAPGNVFSVTQTAGRFLRFNVAQCEDPALFAVLAEVMGA
jgi:DNA-binding transcriptional MocR family regulator